jgi:DNA-binding response OmpR family regulator
MADQRGMGVMKKVLIIDDDMTLRTLFASLLDRKGFVASHAADGEEAIALLTNARKENGQSEYSLVLLDLDLPKLSGLDVLAFIERSMPEIVKNVAVISAASDSLLRDLEDRGSCGTTLQKPFDVEVFYRRIARCIREATIP